MVNIIAYVHCQQDRSKTGVALSLKLINLDSYLSPFSSRAICTRQHGGDPEPQ